MRSLPTFLAFCIAGLLAGSSQAIAQTADLTLTVEVDRADLQAGVAGMDSATVTVTLENRGGAAVAADVEVLLAAGLQVTPGMAASAMPGSYAPGSGLWSLGPVPGGVSGTLIIPVSLTATAGGCIVQMARSVSPPGLEAGVTIGAGDCGDLQAVLRVSSEACPGPTGPTNIRVVREAVNGGPNRATGVVAVVAGNAQAPDASCTDATPCSLESGETRLIVERNLPVPCNEGDKVFSFEIEVGSSRTADPDPTNNKVTRILTVEALPAGSGGGGGGGSGAGWPLGLIVLLAAAWRRQLYS